MHRRIGVYVILMALSLFLSPSVEAMREIPIIDVDEISSIQGFYSRAATEPLIVRGVYRGNQFFRIIDARTAGNLSLTTGIDGL